MTMKMVQKKTRRMKAWMTMVDGDRSFDVYSNLLRWSDIIMKELLQFYLPRYSTFSSDLGDPPHFWACCRKGICYYLPI